MPIGRPSGSEDAKHWDEQLVRHAQQGDRSAFSELMRRNYNRSLKTAVSILHNVPDAEDEVQNAYWKAFRHLDQFLNGAQFSTWMTRIVVNQCLMRLRRDRRARFVYFDEEPDELKDKTSSPEHALGSSQVGVLLRREIGRIPPLLRNVFLLREVKELPMQEVAASLGITVAAAKSRLLRARAELRSRLQKHGEATLMRPERC